MLRRSRSAHNISVFPVLCSLLVFQYNTKVFLDRFFILYASLTGIRSCCYFCGVWGHVPEHQLVHSFSARISAQVVARQTSRWTWLSADEVGPVVTPRFRNCMNYQDQSNHSLSLPFLLLFCACIHWSHTSASVITLSHSITASSDDHTRRDVGFGGAKKFLAHARVFQARQRTKRHGTRNKVHVGADANLAI